MVQFSIYVYRSGLELHFVSFHFTLGACLVRFVSSRANNIQITLIEDGHGWRKTDIQHMVG